jgi:Ca2+/Na+ antiporter
MSTNTNNDPLDAERYYALENINAMILIGFGYLMTAIKTNNLSSLVYTLFVNALSIQIYILFQGFWSQIFTAFKKSFYINVD